MGMDELERRVSRNEARIEGNVQRLAELGALSEQVGRCAGNVERLADTQEALARDMTERIENLRQERQRGDHSIRNDLVAQQVTVEKELRAIRETMTEQFRLVGVRFDTVDSAHEKPPPRERLRVTFVRALTASIGLVVPVAAIIVTIILASR